MFALRRGKVGPGKAVLCSASETKMPSKTEQKEGLRLMQGMAAGWLVARL